MTAHRPPAQVNRPGGGVKGRLSPQALDTAAASRFSRPHGRCAAEIVPHTNSLTLPRTADLTLLKQSDLLQRLPPGVGALGDLAYVSMAKLHPQGLAATPRRKPRSRERPPEDKHFNQAFSRRRVLVEHTIGRMRRFQSLSQMDRHHRKNHSQRTRAVAGLVNRHMRANLPC